MFEIWICQLQFLRNNLTFEITLTNFADKMTKKSCFSFILYATFMHFTLTMLLK